MKVLRFAYKMLKYLAKILSARTIFPSALQIYEAGLLLTTPRHFLQKYLYTVNSCPRELGELRKVVRMEKSYGNPPENFKKLFYILGQSSVVCGYLGKRWLLGPK